MAKVKLRFQAVETQLDALRPKKRKKVEISPNSRFADIETIWYAQERSMKLRVKTTIEILVGAIRDWQWLHRSTGWWRVNSD